MTNSIRDRIATLFEKWKDDAESNRQHIIDKIKSQIAYFDKFFEENKWAISDSLQSWEDLLKFAKYYKHTTGKEISTALDSRYCLYSFRHDENDMAVCAIVSLGILELAPVSGYIIEYRPSIRKDTDRFVINHTLCISREHDVLRYDLDITLDDYGTDMLNTINKLLNKMVGWFENLKNQHDFKSVQDDLEERFKLVKHALGYNSMDM